MKGIQQHFIKPSPLYTLDKAKAIAAGVVYCLFKIYPSFCIKNSKKRANLKDTLHQK